MIDGEAIALTSRYLANTFLDTDPLGNPLVAFEWTGDGPELSEQVTTRLVGQPLGIFLDDELLSAADGQPVDPRPRRDYRHAAFRAGRTDRRS